MTVHQGIDEDTAPVVDQLGHIARSAEILNAMANVSRLRVLSHLIGKEISVGSLSEKVGLSQSALSQHLAKMRSAGLVQTRRQAQTIFYSCNSVVAIRLVALLTDFYPA